METAYINDLKYQIERILRWEPSQYWRHRDFTLLSEQIMAHTNCWVEAHDLELFWQKSVTTPGLLDSLAQFVDYVDWLDFCARNQIGEMIPLRPDAFHAPMWEIPMRWVILICWLSVLASVLICILLLRKP
ncbi:hypothetical protein [Spirosoma fluminis]